jgi:GNAT superfamily N-acetyltransferase
MLNSKKMTSLKNNTYVDLIAINSDVVSIEHIESIMKNKGYGTKIMTLLTDLADRYKVELELHPSSFHGVLDDYGNPDKRFEDALPQEELRAWYRSYGFDNDDTRGMVRPPIHHMKSDISEAIISGEIDWGVNYEEPMPSDTKHETATINSSIGPIDLKYDMNHVWFYHDDEFIGQSSISFEKVKLNTKKTIKVPYIAMINFKPEYQNKGIGYNFYNFILEKYGYLLSDYSQTEKAYKLWSKLIQKHPTRLYDYDTRKLGSKIVTDIEDVYQDDDLRLLVQL